MCHEHWLSHGHAKQSKWTISWSNCAEREREPREWIGQRSSDRTDQQTEMESSEKRARARAHCLCTVIHLKIFKTQLWREREKMLVNLEFCVVFSVSWCYCCCSFLSLVLDAWCDDYGHFVVDLRRAALSFFSQESNDCLQLWNEECWFEDGHAMPAPR